MVYPPNLDDSRYPPTKNVDEEQTEVEFLRDLSSNLGDLMECIPVIIIVVIILTVIVIVIIVIVIVIIVILLSHHLIISSSHHLIIAQPLPLLDKELGKDAFLAFPAAGILLPSSNLPPHIPLGYTRSTSNWRFHCTGAGLDQSHVTGNYPGNLS